MVESILLVFADFLLLSVDITTVKFAILLNVLSGGVQVLWFDLCDQEVSIDCLRFCVVQVLLKLFDKFIVASVVIDTISLELFAGLIDHVGEGWLWRNRLHYGFYTAFTTDIAIV